MMTRLIVAIVVSAIGVLIMHYGFGLSWGSALLLSVLLELVTYIVAFFVGA